MFGWNKNELCRDCKHFDRWKVGDKRVVRKCDIYGVTASEASDWCASYPACGLFNQDYVGRNIIAFVTPERAKKIDNEPIDGQLSFLDEKGK